MNDEISRPVITKSEISILDLKGRIRNNPLNYSALGLISLIFLIISILYFANIQRWSQAPEFGWTVSTQAGVVEIMHLRAHALAAGLRVGDRFESVNGKSISGLGEVREYLDREIPGENVYEVLRKGKIYTIVIQNVARGFGTAFLQYGLTWLLGLLSFILGAAVFIMKPGTRSSWAYLSATFSAALYIMFSITSKLSPDWLYRIYTFGATFSSAAILHLANVFPREREWIKGRKIPVAAPYAISALLFLAIALKTAIYVDAPKYLYLMTESYRGMTMLFFLGSVFFFYLNTSTEAQLARIRARVVLFGAVIALLLPAVDIFMTVLFSINIVPHPAYYVPFYLFFPLAIAYAIIKHNLFDVDLFVKRAVGYGLMTALVGGLYVGLAVSMKPVASVFPGLDRVSALYPMFFALLVVFFFRPIHSKLQAGVDRLFYRNQYNYKDAVISLGDTLTTVFDLNEVIIRIIHAVRDVMAIDTAGVILIQPDRKNCPALFIHDALGNRRNEAIDEGCLELDNPIVTLVQEEKKLITKYDVAENPRYAEIREMCDGQFETFRSTMAFPLSFHGNVIGILLVGLKKSGHFYTREDIDLLNTLASQGAIAIENAKRAEKMKDEEVVRANLARYMSPQVVEQIMGEKVNVSLSGETKRITVLISDIRGFTKLTKTQPPDTLVALLNEYRTEMGRIIFENHGSLDKYVGDAIVAVYGSLIDLENPTSNAVKTAIDMINRMVWLNEKWSSEYDGLKMDIGIGIDTGEVFLGNVGSPERMEFTVIGEAVNMADFLSNTAKPKQILLSEAAYAALGGSIDVRELELKDSKGKQGDQRVLELVR